MTLQYTETVCKVNRHYTGMDIPRRCGMRDYADMDFTANMKRYREGCGLTQAELAERIDVAQATVQRWEAGKREPSHDDLVKIAKVLEIAVADLFRDAEAEPVPTEGELARMIERAMGVLPVGVSYVDYPQAVSSSLREQLKRYQAVGGYKGEDEGSAPDKGAPPPKPTKPSARAKSRTP